MNAGGVGRETFFGAGGRASTFTGGVNVAADSFFAALNSAYFCL